MKHPPTWPSGAAAEPNGLTARMHARAAWLATPEGQRAADARIIQQYARRGIALVVREDGTLAPYAEQPEMRRLAREWSQHVELMAARDHRALSTTTRTAPRPRGAGRPRAQAARRSSTSRDDGEPGPGESDPPSRPLARPRRAIRRALGGRA